MESNRARVASAVFLICAASVGIAGLQYHASKGLDAVADGHITVEVLSLGVDNAEQSDARYRATAIQTFKSSSPWLTSNARGNFLKKGEIVKVGQLATIVIPLPKEIVFLLMFSLE